MNDSRNMVTVFVSDDNSPGAADGSLDLFRRFRIVRFHHATSEKIVDLLVHTGIDHHISVAIDNLEDGSGLHAGLVRRTLHRKFLGPAAFRKLQDVNAQRRHARDHPGHLPYLIDGCRPDLLFLRSDKEKREQDKMKCIFHRSAFLIVTKMLPRTGSIMKRSLL